MVNRLTLSEFANRPMPPAAWSEGEKIPWNEPEFSARMLNEHLTQDHDMASRKTETIARHVEILSGLLPKRPSRILDLGCGPGLYCQRLAAMGHECTGIDISPASIEYARRQAIGLQLDINYIHEDIRTAVFPIDQDLALVLFGEFNVFTPEDARLILRKTWESLRPGGILAIEPSTYDGIRGLGHSSPFWKAMPSGLFCASPHIWLYEAFWDETMGTTTERHCILSEGDNAVQVYTSSCKAYQEDELKDLVMDCGFESAELKRWEDFGLQSSPPGFHLLVARR